jgi:phospholipid/cholesterol/gamma-HCH transport system ATP-binding protein
MSLEIKKLTKQFGERRVLNEIDLHIPEGEILFILGKSGTGKSVLLKNIVGLLKPDGGEIWLDKQEISGLSEDQYFPIRKKCGMVFQHPALFDSLTVFDNVAFGLRRHFPELSEDDVSERVMRFLSLVNLSGRGVEKKLPPHISYGMQKRVSLARTVAIEPRYLLFDEPTTGLDPVTTNAINRLIMALSRKLKTTSIVVSHDMHCALEIADRIAVLDQGKVLALGTPQELRQSQVPLVREFLAEVHEEEGKKT